MDSLKIRATFINGAMNPVKLQDFLQFLDSQSPRDFKGDATSRFLTDRPFARDAFAPFTIFRDDKYGRNLVSKNENYELIVLTWLPKQRTPIHDHGSSRCWMWLMQGSLAVRNYDYPCETKRGLNCQGSVETLTTGKLVYIDDDLGVHSLANASNEPAVSVHLYAGPIPRCQIYNEAERRMNWVDLCYFTEGGRILPQANAPLRA